MIEDNPIHRSGQHLERGSLDALESQLKAALPVEYRDFLLESNGGIPERRVFRPIDAPADDEYWIDEFFVVGDDLANPNPDADPSHISFWTARFAGQLPPNALPIAAVSRDSILLIFVGAEDPGGMWVLDWDLAYDGSHEPTPEEVRRACRKAADSFGQFYGGLYSSE